MSLAPAQLTVTPSVSEASLIPRRIHRYWPYGLSPDRPRSLAICTVCRQTVHRPLTYGLCIPTVLRPSTQHLPSHHQHVLAIQSASRPSIASCNTVCFLTVFRPSPHRLSQAVMRPSPQSLSPGRHESLASPSVSRLSTSPQPTVCLQPVLRPSSHHIFRPP